MTEYVDKAKSEAIRLHFGKFNGKVPRVVHSMLMARKCKGFPEFEAAAWLHNIMDAGGNVEDLVKMGIPSNVIKAVVCLQKNSDETEEAYLERVSKNEMATIIKVFDLTIALEGSLSPSERVAHTSALLYISQYL